MQEQPNLFLWNEDCITGAELHLADRTADLIICDPPFGINESKLDQIYKRRKGDVIPGYVEAPDDYYTFTLAWMEQAKRVLKDDGSLYIIIGHTPLLDVMLAAKELGLEIINHLIWKFNFGAFTKRKYVTSHYHILYLAKKGAKRCFNINCRFGPQEKDGGGSLRYRDVEDVFFINKEYIQDKKKNVNKLPNELIKKIIQYSSNRGDLIIDFFMGNFTTAYVALALGRRVGGFELNKESFEFHLPLLKEVEFGSLIEEEIKVDVPNRQGSKFEPNEKQEIYNDYSRLIKEGIKKKDIMKVLMEQYERGYWSIQRVIDDHKKEYVI